MEGNSDDLDLLSRSLDSIPPLSEVDLKGQAEDKKFSTLDKDNTKYVSAIRKANEDTELAEAQANLYSQQARKSLLWLLRWPLVACAVVLVILVLWMLVMMLVISVKVGFSAFSLEGRDLYNHVLAFTKQSVFLGILTPVGAFIALVLAWLLKRPKKD